ncbi:MAG: hypothetical protein HY047_14365 [Acidobacteria bacterium]|nr:hypothetical protein [Acidobacteriota bacterium]
MPAPLPQTHDYVTSVPPPWISPAISAAVPSRWGHATHRVALRIDDPTAGSLVCDAAVSVIQTVAAQHGVTLEFAPWIGGAPKEARHLNGTWDAVYAIARPLGQNAEPAGPYVTLRSVRLIPGARWCGADRTASSAKVDSRWLLAPPRARRDEAWRDGLAHFACEVADVRHQRLICVIDSTERDASRWDEALATAAVSFPGVLIEKLDVSPMATLLRADPARLDVVLTTTPRAATLVDLCAGRCGCVGLDPIVRVDISGWLPPTVTSTAGTDAQWLGTEFANPLGAIWAGALLFDCLGHRTAYLRIMSAVDRALVSEARPFALGGRATTAEFSHAVRRALREN